MNDKFLGLPQEKRQQIINAGYHVFSKNSYKKAPMSEIADNGGISKALLFHYFRNKKDLYLYLWKNAIHITRNAMVKKRVLETSDFFEMLKRSLSARCCLMREHPSVYAFTLTAYYEQLPEIKEAIQESYIVFSEVSRQKVFEQLDETVFRTDIDLKMMYKEVFYAVDGYMLNKYRWEHVVPDEIEAEFSRLIQFWRTIYLKKEGEL